jgi:small subunit ribosomal protein S9
MSFFRIKALRPFADFHKVFGSRPTYPEETVKAEHAYSSYAKIDKLRKRRMWMLYYNEMAQNAIDTKSKKDSEPVNSYFVQKKPKDQAYYNSRGLLDPKEGLSSIFDMDKETFLPYGLGYDSYIRELKDKPFSEETKDSLRDFYIKMGFLRSSQVTKEAGNINLGQSIEKIKRKIYSYREKTREIPYENIENASNPKNVNNEFKDPEYFSEDYSDKEIESEFKESFDRAKKIFKNKISESSEVEVSNDEINEALNYGHSPTYDDSDSVTDPEYKIDFKIPVLPIDNNLNDYWTREELSKTKKRTTYTTIKNVAKLIKENYKNKNNDIFPTYTPDGKLQSYDFEYNYKIKKGFAPSFREVMVEAEKIIASDSNLKLLHQRDQYEQNNHFIPRYLDKEITSQDYFWTFMPKPEESVYPGYMKKSPPFREDPKTLTEITDSFNKMVAQGYVEDSKDTSLKVYSLIKNDPYHMHFLNNQIKYWKEAIRESVIDFPKGTDKKSVPMIPWEYITPIRKKVFKSDYHGKQVLDKEGYSSGFGKRKRSRAFAYLKPGFGEVTINGLNLINYFTDLVSRNRIIQPFIATGIVGTFDAKVRVYGGGYMGQSQAIQLAISRAITKYLPGTQSVLHENDLMTRDSRNVERKKMSKYKARKSYTYVKR